MLGAFFPFCDVVTAHAVEIGQADDEGEGRLPLALLIVGIGGLVHAQLLGQLYLGQVGVLPQVPYPSVVQTPSLPSVWMALLCLNTTNDVDKIQQTMYYFA